MSNEQILNNLNIAILCVDASSHLQFINQAAEHLLEISGKRALGLPLTALILNPHELEAYLSDAQNTGQMYTRRKVKLDLSTGRSVTCDYAITPMLEQDPPQLLIEIYGLDRYLRIDRDESITSHTEITRQMIRGLAHEIKNPLGGIRGSAQLLARELDDEQLQQYTDVIIDETDRLTTLVDRLLGPRNLPKPEHINIHEILERVRTLIEMEAEQSLHISRDYDPSIPDIYVDPELMVQVFLNIARNAMQSLVETKNAKLCFKSRVERQFTIGNKVHKLVIRIDITDNGPGIADHLKEHLFYPMITGREGGTGLGLSVAQTIIHQANGLIEFDSEVGKTTFSIILPLELTK